jgi:hypothetical protein
LGIVLIRVPGFHRENRLEKRHRCPEKGQLSVRDFKNVESLCGKTKSLKLASNLRASEQVLAADCLLEGLCGRNTTGIGAQSTPALEFEGPAHWDCAPRGIVAKSEMPLVFWAAGLVKRLCARQ